MSIIKWKLKNCRTIDDIIQYFENHSITDAGRNKTNDQFQQWIDSIEKTQKANCMDISIGTMCILFDNKKPSGILIITMQKSSTSKPSHWIAWGMRHGQYVVFNYINPTLKKVTVGPTLDIAMSSQLDWMHRGYERDFNVSLEDVYYTAVPDSIGKTIYSYYIDNKKIKQSELIKLVNANIRQ